MVTRGSSVDEFIKTLNQSTEILKDIKDMVEREELSPSEINRR